MKLIELNRKKYYVPEKWNELSEQQLLEIMDCLFVMQYTGDQALLKLLKILCNMSFWEFFHTPVTTQEKRVGFTNKKIEVTGMDEFLYLTEFLVAEKAGLTKQLMPEYDDLHGPADSFANLIMEEMMMCEQFYLQWWNDKERIDHLNELCAVLYRPAKKNYDFTINPDGDIRIEYNQNICSFMAKSKIAYWPMKVKLAIVTWYDGCRHELQELNPEVFGGEGGEVASYGLISVIRRVAKDGTFGNFDSVKKKEVHLVMIDINESIREAKEAEKAIKDSRK